MEIVEIIQNIFALSDKVNIHGYKDDEKILTELKGNIAAILEEAFFCIKSTYKDLDAWEKISISRAIACLKIFPNFASLSLLEIEYALTPRDKRPPEKKHIKKWEEVAKNLTEKELLEEIKKLKNSQ